VIGCCLKYGDKYLMSMEGENKFNNIKQIQKRGLNRTQSGNYFWLPLEKNGELGRNEIIILFCYSFSKYMKEFTNKACHYLCTRGDHAHHWKYDYCLFQYPGFICFRKNVFETYQDLLHTQLSPILPGDPNIKKKLITMIWYKSIKVNGM